MAYVRDYTCGTCVNYTYEGENTKGYCSYYKTYYYHDESCSHWERSPAASSSGGCFVTTACCQYKGLEDDCYELTTLRRLRDDYMKNTPMGNSLVKMYYDKAPALVEALDKCENKGEVYENIYKRITEVAKLTNEKKYSDAVGRYISMMMYCDEVIGADNK